MKASFVPLDPQNSAPKSVEPTAPLPPASWDSVLKLLGLILVVDKKPLKEAVDTFLNAVNELSAKIDPTQSMTEDAAHDWFQRKKPDLEAIRESEALDLALCNILEPIMSMPHKLDVIFCLVRMAISDGEYSAAEKSLIKRVVLYWDIGETDFSNYGPVKI